MAVDLWLDGHDLLQGSSAVAGWFQLPYDGAKAGSVVCRLLVSEHRFKKEKLWDDEQLTAKSTASSVRSERE